MDLELETTLKLVIKHALFGNIDSFNQIIRMLNPNVKEYMLLNLTKFTNNLVDLISKIKVNSNGYALPIKDIEETNDYMNNLLIKGDNIFIKSNHLLNYSPNLMIKSLEPNMNLNLYDSLIDVLMNFFYNKSYSDYMKQDNHFFAAINFDQTSGLLKRMLENGM